MPRTKKYSLDSCFNCTNLIGTGIVGKHSLQARLGGHTGELVVKNAIEDLLEEENALDYVRNPKLHFLCADCFLSLQKAINRKTDARKALQEFMEREGIGKNDKDSKESQKCKCIFCQHGFEYKKDGRGYQRLSLVAKLHGDLSVEDAMEAVVSEEMMLEVTDPRNTHMCVRCLQCLKRVVSNQPEAEKFTDAFLSKTHEESLLARRFNMTEDEVLQSEIDSGDTGGAVPVEDLSMVESHAVDDDGQEFSFVTVDTATGEEAVTPKTAPSLKRPLQPSQVSTGDAPSPKRLAVHNSGAESDDVPTEEVEKYLQEIEKIKNGGVAGRVALAKCLGGMMQEELESFSRKKSTWAQSEIYSSKLDHTWELLLKEIAIHMPTVHMSLVKAMGVPNTGNVVKQEKCGNMLAILLNAVYPDKFRFVQSANSLQMAQFGANKKIINTMSKKGICLNGLQTEVLVDQHARNINTSGQEDSAIEGNTSLMEDVYDSEEDLDEDLQDQEDYGDIEEGEVILPKDMDKELQINEENQEIDITGNYQITEEGGLKVVKIIKKL